MPFDNLVRFLQEKTKNLKKGDWIALALTGVLLLVVALPAPSAGSAKKEKSSMHVAENKTEENQEKQGDYQREYASVLEKELEEALCQAILQKPEAHHFQERDPEREAEETFMARIGG